MVTLDTHNIDNLSAWLNALLRAKKERIKLKGIKSHRSFHNALVASSDRARTYYVMVDTRKDTPVAYCTCLSGHHDKVCKHAALVMDSLPDYQFDQHLLNSIIAGSAPQEAA